MDRDGRRRRREQPGGGPQRADARLETAGDFAPDRGQPLHLAALVAARGHDGLELREVFLEALAVGGGLPEELVDVGAVIAAPADPERRRPLPLVNHLM